jgi:peptidoglycan/xylan/chitin deacetylase (PgdA/CDA1 family)
LKQVEETRQIILDIALDLFILDRDVRYLRPPYGATDANSRQYAAGAGYAIVLWDIDPQDWRRSGAKVIADHVVREAYPEAIVLMHDGGGDRAQSVAALEMILRELSQQGYAFRNVYVP